MTIDDFRARATPEERADLDALLPVILGRRGRHAEQHAAAQREAPTTRRQPRTGRLRRCSAGSVAGARKAVDAARVL